MGTHPIFESDFDCLTDINSLKMGGTKKGKSSTKLTTEKSKKEQKPNSKPGSKTAVNNSNELATPVGDKLDVADSRVTVESDAETKVPVVTTVSAKETEHVPLDPVTDLYPLLINSWSGFCVEGVPHGEGRCEFRSGTTYTGQMAHGLMHGEGSIRLAGGFTYRGEFKKNVLSGRGSIEFPDGGEYEGDVVDGYRHGQGHYARGEITYTGGWSWGKRHGTGVMRYSSSSFYDGQFNNGLEHGYGVRQWESMDLYRGEYQNGKRHGKGLMIWRQVQEEYDGEWRHGEQNGFGIGVTLKNGKRTVYKGEWKDACHHGPGRAEYSDGSVLIGTWNMNRKEGAFEVLYSTGANDNYTKFDNDKIDARDNNQVTSNFESLTERELLSTFGPELIHGKEAIVRNIKKCRELYTSYAAKSADAKFYLMHFDRLMYDFELSHDVPVSELYAEKEKDASPLRHLLFRQFALYLVHAAARLWPEVDLDSAVQKLFDNYFDVLTLKSGPNESGLLFSDECRELIHPLFMIWDNQSFAMTGKHFLQFIRRLKLPFTMKNAIDILATYDRRITERVERPITFVQFAETLLKLIVQQKERQQREHLALQRLSKTPPCHQVEEEASKEPEGKQESVKQTSKTSLPGSAPSEVVSDVRNVTNVSTRASGSLLQTISNLSEDCYNAQPKTSNDFLYRGEMAAYFNEELIPAWVTWKKIDEIAREEPEHVIVDFSGLIVTSKTTIASIQSDSVLSSTT